MNRLCTIRRSKDGGRRLRFHRYAVSPIQCHHDGTDDQKRSGKVRDFHLLI